MSVKNDERWLANYEALKAYIAEHHHLPDKHKAENRGLLSWWKYQMIILRHAQEPLDSKLAERKRMLQTLADSRSKEHTGGRSKKIQNIE